MPPPPPRGCLCSCLPGTSGTLRRLRGHLPGLSPLSPPERPGASPGSSGPVRRPFVVISCGVPPNRRRSFRSVACAVEPVGRPYDTYQGDSWSHSCTNRLILHWNGNVLCAYLDKVSIASSSFSTICSDRQRAESALSSSCKRVQYQGPWAATIQF